MPKSYINKVKKVPIPPATPLVTPNSMDNLVPTDLKTHVVGVSAIVKKGGKTLQHINLSSVRDYFIEGSSLIINSIDSAVPTILTFSAPSAAQQAEVRFTAIMNGQDLI